MYPNKIITNQYELIVFAGACYDFLLVSISCMEINVNLIDFDDFSIFADICNFFFSASVFGMEFTHIHRLISLCKE